jgi:hypothetical protein
MDRVIGGWGCVGTLAASAAMLKFPNVQASQPRKTKLTDH